MATVKAREGEYRIYGSRFTRAGRCIEHVDLKYLTDATLAEACRVADEMRAEQETDCFLIRMEQLYDVLPGGSQ